MRATVAIDKAILDELVHESGHKNKAAALRKQWPSTSGRGNERRSRA